MKLLKKMKKLIMGNGTEVTIEEDPLYDTSKTINEIAQRQRNYNLQQESLKQSTYEPYPFKEDYQAQRHVQYPVSPNGSFLSKPGTYLGVGSSSGYGRVGSIPVYTYEDHVQPREEEIVYIPEKYIIQGVTVYRYTNIREHNNLYTFNEVYKPNTKQNVLQLEKNRGKDEVKALYQYIKENRLPNGKMKSIYKTGQDSIRGHRPPSESYRMQILNLSSPGITMDFEDK